KHGVQAVSGDVVAACKGEYNDDFVKGVKYVKDGELEADAVDYLKSHQYLKDAGRAAAFVGNEALDAAKSAGHKGLDAAKYVFCGDMKDDIVDGYKYAFKGGLEHDVKERYDYITSVQPLKDLGAIAANLGIKVATDVGELVGINPEERYAVVVAGFDWDEAAGPFGMYRRDNPQWFMNETCKAYNDLLQMGFKPENIRVLSPNEAPGDTSYLRNTAGYDEFRDAFKDHSYSHEATRQNVTRVLEDMASKVDSNDVFVMYVGTHGNTDWNGDSYVCLDNGDQQMTWKEMKHASDKINGGREIYIVDACHSGDFANLADEEHEEAIAASKDTQVAYSDSYGDSFARYFLNELKNIGVSRNMPDSAIKTAADVAMQRFKRGNYGAASGNQVAQYGSGGDVQQVA
ncbi:MAG: C13 family peptidase, partial [Nanoarchaeota archaeon]|nr:C13 family peptidase [Nanoarchaeota archaeon]